MDRQAATIELDNWNGELDKYEYLTGEYLGYKPDVIQKAKFEYSPLVQVFNKGLDESDKKEGILKRLKNIEDQLDIKPIGYTVGERFSQGAKNILDKLSNQEKLINYKKLDFKGSSNTEYYFGDYRSLKELFKAIYYKKSYSRRGRKTTR